MEGAHIRPIPSASFSARVELETTQTLADGSTVSHHTFNIIARDFRGRTHNEFRQWSNPATGAEANLRCAILYDPDTRTRTYLYPASHLARQYVYAENIPSAAAPVTSANDPSAPTVQKEDLGEKFSDSLRLTGLRETKTYPQGGIDNAQPLAITTEYWYSPDLQINVSVKRTDPRFGVQTVELTELRREEPDAALFEIPPDYKVVNESGAAGVVASSSAPDTTISGGGSFTRIMMGGNVQAAKLLVKVTPDYPILARQTHIEGAVRLHAIIDKEGVVASLTVQSGHPLLVKAALDAVSQWRYQPTMLNGSPVEIDTTIDVIFQLISPPPPTPAPAA
jgi:TonB family protein